MCKINESDDKISSGSEEILLKINTDVLEKLRKFANVEGTSLEIEINKLLLQDVDWDILASKAGWIPMPKFVLIAFFEHISELTILEIARTNKNIVKDMVLTMRGEYNLKELIKILRARSKAAGFNYIEHEEKNKTHIVMQHNMGLKWSKYFKVLHEMAIEELNVDIEVIATENAITYTIDKTISSINK